MYIGEHNKKKILENDKNVQKQPLEVFHEKAVLKNFAIFIGKTLSWSLFLINTVNMAEFLRTAILKNICERLLLNVVFNRNEEQQLLVKLDEMGKI